MPYCFGCETELQYVKGKVTTDCAEGTFKSKTEVPYCPQCEPKPQTEFYRYG